MSRPRKDTFNDFIGMPSGETRRWCCADCKRWADWTQKGNLPQRCQPCAHRHNRIVGAKPGDEPWDLSVCDGITDPLKAIDRVLHWSPERRRHLYWDGYRWVWASDTDARKIAMRIVAPDTTVDERDDNIHHQVAQLLKQFEELCEARFECTQSEGGTE